MAVPSISRIAAFLAVFACGAVVPLWSCRKDFSLSLLQRSTKGGGSGAFLNPGTALSEGEENEMNETLAAIFTSTKTDKMSRHHYERYYDRWFAPFQKKTGVKFLEIGVHEGASLNAWKRYFQKPELIMGLAYGTGSPNSPIDHDQEWKPGVFVHVGDQATNESMDYLKAKGPWDVIVDDGSHVPEHQIFSLFKLWESIKPGGKFHCRWWSSRNQCHCYMYI